MKVKGRIKSKILYLLVVGMLHPAITNAQQKEMIKGTVKDSRSAAIEGASVRLLNTNITVFTGPDGDFIIKDVNGGSYLLEVSALGFALVTKQVVAGSSGSGIHIILERVFSQLSHVVVTAQKKEELLQQVPAGITAINAAQIEKYRLWNTEEITGISPNLFVANPGDKRNVTGIRGIVSTSYDPAIATYIDGVNQFSLDAYLNSLLDVERIEVLRGPQGILYGRTAMGGVINIITKKPHNQASGSAELSFGNYGLQRYNVAVKTPLMKDRIYFGAAVVFDRMDGYYTNVFDQSNYDRQRSASGNYYLRFLASKKWDITLNLKHSANRNRGAFTLVHGIEEAFKHPFELNQDAVTQMVDNILNTSVSVNYAGAKFNFNSQTAYQHNYRFYEDAIDADFSPLDALSIFNNYGRKWNKVDVLTQELRFSSPAGNTNRLNWAVGFYTFIKRNPVKQATQFGEHAMLLGLPDNDFSVVSSTKSKGAAIAFFGQAGYKLNKKIELTVGLRYDYEYMKNAILGEYIKEPFPVMVIRGDTAADARFRALSPYAGISYAVSRTNLLYLSYRKGFRPGGLTPLSTDPSQPPLVAFKPEYSYSVEAGSKNMIVPDKLLMNLFVFYSGVYDAQVPGLVLPDAVTITRNTGKLTSKGVELELIALPASNFQLQYSFGYVHARFNRLKISQNGSEADLKGSRQVFTPEVTSMFSAGYEFRINTSTKVGLNLEWKYLGEHYFDLANTLRQPGYHVLNVRAGFGIKKYSVFCWARNLTDTRYINYGYDFGAVRTGNPRTYGVTVKALFGKS
ncbi:MAG TPA: TonB-dependent receptor [Chitinophagaceae bacterium]